MRTRRRLRTSQADVPSQHPSCTRAPEALASTSTGSGRSACAIGAHPGMSPASPVSINHPGERRSGPTTRGVFAVKIFAIEESGHRRSPSIGDPQPRRGAKVAKSEIAERIDGQLTVEASTPSHQIADARRERQRGRRPPRGAIAGAVDQRLNRCRRRGQRERVPPTPWPTSGGGWSVTCTTGSRTSWWR